MLSFLLAFQKLIFILLLFILLYHHRQKMEESVVTEIFVSRDDGKPKLRQKLPTRTRQVVCASYHAWFLLGKTPHPQCG